MRVNRNAPPKTGWSNILTELHVADLDVSLGFWADIIGFEIAYAREAQKFVYLEHPEGQQIMLCQRHGRFETGAMQHPLGQGAMFQIYFRDIGAILAKLAAQKWPIYLGPRENWRETGDREIRSTGGLCSGPRRISADAGAEHRRETARQS
jgi:catechol 2,3-dioxygenase-like lactoylglutathione lyase family enzyme